MKNTAKKAMLGAAAFAAALLMSGCSSGNGNANSAMSSPAMSSSGTASNGTSSAFTEESETPLESMLDPFESMIPDDMFDPSNGNVSE